MEVYTIKPSRFGEDAVPKEVRYLVATARAGGQQAFLIDGRALSKYLRVAVRHSLSALKKEGKINFYVPAERFGTEDVGVAFLLARDETIKDEPLLADKDGGVTVVAF